MPTTRAARRAAAAREANEQASLLCRLLPDLQASILYQLTTAHDIAAVAPTCHALCDAAKIAFKARPFTGVVVKLAGHTRDLNGVAAAPDGRVITGSDDKTVKVWRDGVCERTIQAHDSMVEAVAVLPGGARFVSVSADRTAKLWTLGGALERTFEVGTDLYCVAALPDGVHFVIGIGMGDNQGEVRLYHVDGTLVHTFEGQRGPDSDDDDEDEDWIPDVNGGHTDAVYELAVTPDGQHVISASSDTLVKVWSVASKSLVSTCRGHTDSVYAVAVMPDGQRILSGSTDHTVGVWLLNGTLHDGFKLHTDWVTALVALPDNQHALSGSADNTATLFDVNNGNVLRTFMHHTGPFEASVVSLALLPDGLRFVSGSYDVTARIVEHGLAPIKA